MTRRDQLERCGVAGHRRGYWDRYDMFGCVVCDRWTSTLCGCTATDMCPYAVPPERPSMSPDAPEYFGRDGDPGRQP